MSEEDFRWQQRPGGPLPRARVIERGQRIDGHAEVLISSSGVPDFLIVPENLPDVEAHKGQKVYVNRRRQYPCPFCKQPAVEWVLKHPKLVVIECEPCVKFMWAVRESLQISDETENS